MLLTMENKMLAFNVRRYCELEAKSLAMALGIPICANVMSNKIVGIANE